MNPWPCPMSSLTIRPVDGSPLRSAGRDDDHAGGRVGARFRKAPRESSPTLPARLTAPMRLATAESAAALGFRPRFVDGETAPADLRPVDLADRLLRIVVSAHLHEAEPSRAARRLVAHHRDGFDRSDCGEELLKLRFSDLVRQVSHIQLPTHIQTPLSQCDV